VNVQRVDEVVRLDTAEVVPVLMISTAQQTGVVYAAAVVHVGQVVTDGADVCEVDVLLHDALASAHQRRPVLTIRHCPVSSSSSSSSSSSFYLHFSVAALRHLTHFS